MNIPVLKRLEVVIWSYSSGLERRGVPGMNIPVLKLHWEGISRCFDMLVLRAVLGMNIPILVRRDAAISRLCSGLMSIGVPLQIGTSHYSTPVLKVI